MKSTLHKTLFLTAAFFAAGLTAARSQSYSIDWYKVSGGGGTSTGGVYSVSGTIGQPDAGSAMSGGEYSLTGGFWSLYAVQTPGAPLLTITYSANQAIVSWPSPSTGFVLEQNSNLANVRSDGGSLVRARLAGSRMTGFTVAKGLVKDVVFDECRMDLSAWRFTDFKAVRFDNCNLARADFTESNLSGAQFVGCDLTAAQFDRATMDGATFRRCVLAGIGGVMSWRGAVVGGADLIALSHTLAAAIGIRVEPD